MRKLIKDLEVFDKTALNFESLGKFIYKYDFENLAYENELPELSTSTDYSRKIYCLKPLECVLLRWPPGVESAVHFHRGFFGYVVVLSGHGKDVTYKLGNGKMGENRISHCFKGGIIHEPDGVIHKIENAENEELITLHFYFPAPGTLEDLEIFDLENGRIGRLSAKAESANWTNEAGHFKEIKENAFQFIPAGSAKEKSHRIVVVKPKPDDNEIQRLIGRYYNEQAEEYDTFDSNHPVRSAYVETVNALISGDLRNHHLETFLELASGTGKRALDIRKMSGLKFDITGVDMSSEMVKMAQLENDIQLINSNWLNANLNGISPFDAATFLYAFGHISSKERRLRSLQKLNRHLKIGAPFYFDLFNLENKNEWGPFALQAFHRENLEHFGYEKGDVFYRKTCGKEIAFLHYFTEDEIRFLLNETGFKIAQLKYISYGHDSGKIMKNPDEGVFYIKAVKVREV